MNNKQCATSANNCVRNDVCSNAMYYVRIFLAGFQSVGVPCLTMRGVEYRVHMVLLATPNVT